MVLYEYRTSWYQDGRLPVVVVDGERSFVEAYIAAAELAQLFGGWIRSVDPKTGKQFLGVWGQRNGKRLRRLLRERGAQWVICRESPPRQILGLNRTKKLSLVDIGK